MSSLPTLYARAKTGKIKQWTISTDGAKITTIHGLMGGTLKTAERLAEGKNLGKTNETTPEEQAELEAQAKWTKQLDKGYVTDKDNIPKEGEVTHFLPMLAHSADKKRKHVKFPCLLQPKLDGIRCLARRTKYGVDMWSRKGKFFDALMDLERWTVSNDLHYILDEEMVLDGELYVHDWSFQRITSAVKKFSANTTLLEYHVYDVPVSGKNFRERFSIFQEALASRKDSLGVVKVVEVPTHEVKSWEEVAQYEAGYLALGYEGVMLRSQDGKYLFGHRSADLLKVKQFQDDEFEIIGGKEATGKDTGTAVFICRTKDGKEFEARPMGDHALRTRYWNDLKKLTGKWLTVKFQDLTDDGIPRFPVGIAIRDYE